LKVKLPLEVTDLIITHPTLFSNAGWNPNIKTELCSIDKPTGQQVKSIFSGSQYKSECVAKVLKRWPLRNKWHLRKKCIVTN